MKSCNTICSVEPEILVDEAIMWGFCKPWRRKVGVFTLILARMFATAWFRSLFVTDCVSVNFPSRRLDLDSTQGWIELDEIPAIVREYDWDYRLWSESHHPEWGSPRGIFLFQLTTREWSTQDELRNWVSGRGYYFCCRYAVIVLPLAILSAWLLLSKCGPPAKTEPLRNS